MCSIKLLDCTLRDGGYINDWKFGQKNLVSIFERLVDANVDIIEIGFLDERRPFDIDRSIMPNTVSVSKIYGSLERKQAMVVGMIDYGTCGIENIQPCKESFLDGIRVIFKKHLMHEAMEFCRKIKALGYKVFSQLVSITSYNEQELLELISLVNDVKPYAVSMVDTYGLFYPENLLKYYQILDDHVIPEVAIGFHGHNNLQMAYANSLTFLEKDTKHDIIIDGTLYGMGKNAGNAPLELLGMRLNEKYGKAYDVDAMVEAVQESLMSIYADSPWGYKIIFYLCSQNRCHPNYLVDFESKKNLSLSKIDRLLAKIEPEEKKLLYDKLLSERLYMDYLNGEGNDKDYKDKWENEIKGKKILILGPGKNIELQKEKVQAFIEAEKPYVISINYIPDMFHVDCVFTTNARRYHDLTLVLKKEKNQNVKLLATSNVECRNGSFDFVINREPLLEKNEEIIDNSFLMLIKFLSSSGVKEIVCAGFDGYSEKEDNYCNPAMEYSFVKHEAVNLNTHMKKRIMEFREKMDITFITYSAYDKEEDIYGASI